MARAQLVTLVGRLARLGLLGGALSAAATTPACVCTPVQGEQECERDEPELYPVSGMVTIDGAPRAGVWLVPSFEPTEDTYPSNHAAFGETAYQLLFDPEPVDLARLPDDRVPTLDEDGVWGDDPRAATADDGAAILALFLERTVPTVRDLLARHA